MSKQILVLGMHRSGTSMVSRILNLMGCYYSSEDQVMLPAEDNPKGFWERKDVMDLNNKILHDHQATWDDPYKLKDVKINNLLYSKDIKNIIYKLEPHRPWFIKDPRFCLTYNCWANELEHNLNILVLRNPLAVSISLFNRNKISYLSGLALWDFYTDRLIKNLDKKKTILCFYDDFLQDPYKASKNLFNSLKKAKLKKINKPLKEEVMNFVDKQLNRSKLNSNIHLFDQDVIDFYTDKYNRIKKFNSNFSTISQSFIKTEQQAKTITTLNQSLSTKDEEIHNLSSSLSQRMEETEQQAKTITTLNQSLTNKDQEIDLISSLNHENFNKYQNLLKSNSFKITKPLRWFGRLLRGEFKLVLDPFIKNAKDILPKKKINDHFVSIIIVNYNGLNHLESLLNSIYNQTYKKFEILFVDNNSIDESVNFINKNYPKVKIVVNNKNLYFAEANNVGFEKSIGNLILLLNNDTVIEHDFLERLVNKYNQNEEIVAVTPKILFFKKFFKLSLNFNENVYLDYGCLIDNLEYKKSFIKSSHDVTENIIQTNNHELIFYLPENENIILKFKPEAVFNKNLIKNIKINDELFDKFENRNNFEIFITKSFTINEDNKYIINNAGSANYKNPYDVGFGDIDHNQYKDKIFSELICGCAVLIDRYALGYNKLFISEFKNYYEDSELSNRLTKKGKIAFENNAVVYHKHSATSIEHSTHWQYYVARNKIFYDHLLFNETDVENKLNNFLSNKIFKDVTKEKKNFLLDINNLIKREKKLYLKPNVKRVAIYNEFWNTYGGGEKRALDFIYELKLSDYCIDLISSNDFDINNLKKYFNHNNLRLRKRIVDITLQNISSEYDIFINSTYLSNLISFAKKSFYLISFPQKKATQEFLNSYTFVPNSKYTLSWSSKYWGKNFDSKLIYPKFDFDKKNLAKIYNKKKIILSVGRWTPLGHSKKQFEMAQMFHKLTKNKKFQDWSLVLVGSLNEENSIDVKYYNKVKSYLESNKLNFETYYNLERDKLLQLYSKASIYWHFTGFNEDLENKPELAEHFGMTIVEAIMHGCVPYVYKAGGQVEILDILKLDNHFNSFNELEKKMLNTLNKKIKINKNFVKKFIN